MTSFKLSMSTCTFFQGLPLLHFQGGFVTIDSAKNPKKKLIFLLYLFPPHIFTFKKFIITQLVVVPTCRISVALSVACAQSLTSKPLSRPSTPFLCMSQKASMCSWLQLQRKQYKNTLHVE